MASSKKIGIAVAAALIAIGLGYAALSGMSMETMESDNMMSELSGEILVGAIFPLTGDLSSHGEENLAGVKFAIFEFNNFLKETDEDWQFKLIEEDSATNPVVALEKITALNARGVQVVFGPETSSNIRNVKGYADSNNMLIVSCCSSSPALAIPGDSVYRIIPDDTNQGAALGKLLDHQGIQALIPIWRGDTWGDGLSSATKDSFVSRGGTIDEGIRYNPESPEFSVSTSLLAQRVEEYVQQYGADKVGILFLGFGEVLQFMQSASAHEILDDVRWFGPGANTKEKRLIEDSIGLEFAQSIKFTTVQAAASKSDLYDRIEDHIVEEFGRKPQTFVHSAYDSVWLVGLTMLKVQSADTKDIKSEILNVANEYTGAIGDVKLNEAGDLENSNYEVWGIRNGEWILLGEYHYIDDSITQEYSEI